MGVESGGGRGREEEGGTSVIRGYDTHFKDPWKEVSDMTQKERKEEEK